jgi:hypothetical protein
MAPASPRGAPKGAIPIPAVWMLLLLDRRQP